MRTDELFETVKEHASNRLQLILDLCDSEIEKKFVGYFYCFFLRHGFQPQLLTLKSEKFRLLPNNKLESVYKITNYQGLEVEVRGKSYCDPLVREPELLIGFRVNCWDVAYEILPQYPIFDNNQARYLDFAINMVQPKTNKVLVSFAVECDGFEWHHTLPQLNADNRRGRFITKNNFHIVRYTGSEINQMDDNTVIELENTIYHAVFQKDSSLYFLKRN